MNPILNRREFLKASATSALASPLAGLADSSKPVPRGKAEACIFLWMGGGMSQIDTFDPKGRGDGKKVPGCYYNTIGTAIPGAKVSEHLKQTAGILDRCVLLRSLSHEQSAEHGAATYLVHTARKPSETVVYPSIGSVVAHQLGPRTESVPPYVVMGYPNIARDPGFLGPQHGYVYLTQLETGPNGLIRAPDVDIARQQRREGLIGTWQKEFERRNPADKAAIAQGEISRRGFKIAGPEFMNVFNLEREPKTLRENYGGEFGQRCLLARRLVQSGVRFVEVSFNLNFINGTGWDTHNEGQRDQHKLIQELDRAFATLVLDLEKHNLLEKTLVVIATEFGRPPGFDSRGGRGHQSQGFTSVLAGGGLRSGQVIGATDDGGGKIVEHPLTMPDYHATMYCALGINPHKRLHTPDDRPVPITDFGRPAEKLFT